MLPLSVMFWNFNICPSQANFARVAAFLPLQRKWATYSGSPTWGSPDKHGLNQKRGWRESSLTIGNRLFADLSDFSVYRRCSNKVRTQSPLQNPNTHTHSVQCEGRPLRQHPEVSGGRGVCSATPAACWRRTACLLGWFILLFRLNAPPSSSVTLNTSDLGGEGAPCLASLTGSLT